MFTVPFLVRQTNSPPNLAFENKAFVVRYAKAVYRVPIEADKAPDRHSVAYRQNRVFAVWDERGLTIRSGTKLFSTKLAEIAVTPRLFTKVEIRHTLALIRMGTRKKEVSALSGCARVGHIAFFLARWEEVGRRPWLEALVSVDLAGRDARPKLLGRFTGLTVATRQIDDKLFAFDRTPNHPVLAAIVRNGAEWGLAGYEHGTREFGFRPMGSNLVATATLSPTRIAFIEKSAYGTTVLGMLDARTSSRSDLGENRGSARLLDAFNPILEVVNDGGSITLHNVRTGAVLGLPSVCGVRRTPAGIVVFSPSDEPTVATLYDADRLTSCATWRRSRSP